MADFKLSEVAKKIKLTPEEAFNKLKSAGEAPAGIDATLTVEQLRILGIDPQKLIDRRKEKLQQVLDRRNRGSMGKEVVVKKRSGKDEPPTVSVQNLKITKEELLKRKNELNKGIQKVDEERKQYLLQKEKDQSAIAEDVKVEAANVSEPSVINNEKPAEEVPARTEPAIEVEAQADKLQKPEPAPVAAIKPAVTAEIKPAGTVEVKPAGTVEVKPAPAKIVRPTGPAADQRRNDRSYPRRDDGRREGFTRDDNRSRDDNRPRTDSRRPAGSGAAPGRDSKDGRSYEPGRDRGDSRGYQQRPRQTGFTRPEPVTLTEEEKRRREVKKVKEPETTLKEEPKKAKVKTEPLKSKDWSKTIIEGMSELDMEKELEKGASPASEEVAPVVHVTKPDRKYRRKQDKSRQSAIVVTPKPTHISIGETVVVSELAGLIGIKAAELVKKLFNSGTIATVNQSIDAETASLLCLDYGVEVTTKIVTEEDLLPVYIDNSEDIERRPPVVAVMGHVDHGKTSLLDAIRSAAVAEKEAGGITQHIGAYEVELNGRKITFLDTPGHEAFTSLRARGAQVTDIVILVVAANDGVMPQTKEAIDHAKAAGVRIVVAVNKIDRPDANPDRVRQQLAEYGIISDEWGGEYQFQEISAKQRTGIEDLLERVLLEADVLELNGNPKRPAEGIVIESRLDKQKGPVATVLVKNGTLNRGDTFVVGSQVGKVRSMYNYRGSVVKEAGISTPVEVMGFSSVPESGDSFIVVEDEKLAKNIAELRENNSFELKQSSGAVSLSDFFDKVKQGDVQELNIILKADVQGSLEALKNSLLKLSNAEVKVNIVHDATGGINESDVVLAIASHAIIIGFNVRPDANARNLSEKEKISIELYSIIYKAIEDVKMAMEGMLTPESKEKIIGKVEVRQVFSVPKLGKIAGAYVQEGKVTRNSLARVIRDNVVVYDGKIGSLKRFTDDVKEVQQGYECGLSIDKYQDIKEGDILEIYEMVEEKRTLDDVKSEQV